MANNQETNRNTVLEIVDERTRFEMYYPPFEGSVEAGVVSCHDIAGNHLGCIPPKMPAISLLTGVEDDGFSVVHGHPL